MKIIRNKEVQVFANNVKQDVENLLYEYGIRDWMAEDKIVDIIVDKWCEMKGIER